MRICQANVVPYKEQLQIILWLSFVCDVGTLILTLFCICRVASCRVVTSYVGEHLQMGCT